MSTSDTSAPFDPVAHRNARITAATSAVSMLKPIILQTMKDHGITSIVVEYSGSGDIGDIDSIVLDKPQAITMPTHELVTPYLFPQTKAQTLEDYVTALTWNAIETEHAGWENNDGGCGTITFSLDGPEPKIKWEHTTYYTESRDNSYNF